MVESSFLFIVYFLVYIVQLGVLLIRCAVLNRSTFSRGAGSLLGGLRMISLRGMPPFAGFAPKLFLLLRVEHKRILVAPLLGSIWSIKYYTRASCAIILECRDVWDKRLLK